MIARDGSSHASEPDRGSTWQRLLGLRDHSLIRFAAAYGVFAWLIVQIAATVGPAFELPSWFLRAVIGSALLGFFLLLGGAAIIARQRPSGRAGSRQRRWLLGASLAGLVAAVGALGFLARDAVLGDEQVIVAVLPFADLSPGHDKAYFAEGVAEEILSSLATERAIKVLGRTSSRELDRESGPKAIRASLGVTHLLEGSTRTSGDDLRVNVRLIDTADGAEVWEEQYRGRLADVFAVQDRIAATVVKRLRGTFAIGSMRATKETAFNVYQNYLAARALSRDRTEARLTQALNLAKKVVLVDPDYAPGQALLAELLFLLSDDDNAYGTIPVAQARKQGELHARAAIRLAPQAADGYAALGLLFLPKQAIVPLERAVSLDPSRADIRSWLAIRLDGLGRHDEALKLYRAAAEIEPLWAMPIANLVPALTAAGRQDEALQAVRDFRRRGGSEAQADRFLSSIAHWTGDISSGIAYAKAGLGKDPTLPDIPLRLAIDYHIIGLDDRAPGGLSGQYTRLMRPFFSADYVTLRQRIMAAGPRLWDAPDGDFAFFHLAASREWHRLVSIYDGRRPPLSETCEKQYAQIVVAALALREKGREPEARAVLRCGRERASVESRIRERAQNRLAGDLEFERATLGAFDRKPDEALRFLEQAVAAGWLGRPYSSQLADYPQFDLLRAEPRFTALQLRIDRKIAQERAEVLALR